MSIALIGFAAWISPCSLGQLGASPLGLLGSGPSGSGGLECRRTLLPPIREVVKLRNAVKGVKGPPKHVVHGKLGPERNGRKLIGGTKLRNSLRFVTDDLQNESFNRVREHIHLNTTFRSRTPFVVRGIGLPTPTRPKSSKPHIDVTRNCLRPSKFMLNGTIKKMRTVFRNVVKNDSRLESKKRNRARS